MGRRGRPETEESSLKGMGMWMKRKSRFELPGLEEQWNNDNKASSWFPKHFHLHHYHLFLLEPSSDMGSA
ncbi:Hypothetical predicted protein, partial [Marmota monax]